MDPKEPQVADEQQEDPSASGVVVPEEFQQQTHELLKNATTKHHLSHIRDRIYEKEDAMRKAEMAKRPKGKGADINYSTEAMPQSD